MADTAAIIEAGLRRSEEIQKQAEEDTPLSPELQVLLGRYTTSLTVYLSHKAKLTRLKKNDSDQYVTKVAGITRRAEILMLQDDVKFYRRHKQALKDQLVSFNNIRVNKEIDAINVRLSRVWFNRHSTKPAVPASEHSFEITKYESYSTHV